MNRQTLHHRRMAHARVEPLESRSLLAGITVVVDSTIDSFEGNSLRRAIATVDTQGDPSSPNTIVFQVPTEDQGYDPATGTFTFAPLSILPPILRPVTIDGTTESAFIGQPATLALVGTSVKGTANGLTLAPGSNGSTIDGLTVAGFSGSGIVVQSSKNTIGGTAAGTGNVIGSNAAAGIAIVTGQIPASGQGLPPTIPMANVLLGNYIGTDAAGANLANAVGVSIADGASTIGGTAAGAGNVIGFNTKAGVVIAGTDATGNVLLGKFIGTDAGGAARPNPVGVSIGTASNTIGGTSSGAGNVIGFNTGAGVSISGSGASGNVLLGNLIGTNANRAHLSNAIGVSIGTGSNTIGGDAAGASNVIGFSTAAGISISGSGASGNLLLGNFIGTNTDGADLANAVGMLLESGSNTVGGTASGAGNVIGFNSTAGVSISGPGATGNVLLGNRIGTNSAGANLANAIGADVGGPGNTIGGTSAGAANVIGFNTTAGVRIAGPGATGNVLLGNLIGTNADGARRPNNLGVLVNAAGNTIGGTGGGAANVIGCNTTAGVQITGPGASGNVLLGNFIGTDGGDADLANPIGVLVNAAGNTIGGTTPGAANLIGFNTTAGVQIAGGGASGNVLLGNLIGTDASGRNALGNDIGMLLTGGTGTTIGGTTGGAGNVVSGNFTAGIELSGGGVTATQIVGNRIGTDPAGTSAVVQSGQTDPLLARQSAGIAILGSQSNTIGGTSPQARNLISGNYVGVMLAGTSGQGGADQVLGNFIGTDASGAKPLGNIVGVYLNGAAGNQIGGTAPCAGNVISGNSSVGVEIYGGGSTGNLVQGNNIGLAADGRGTFRTSGGSFAQSDGVFIQDASGNTIGGGSGGAGNVITGNEAAGVLIEKL